MLTSKNVNIVFIFFLLALMVGDLFSEIPFWTYALLTIAYISLQTYGSTVLRAAFFVPVSWQGDQNSKKVALTFDDGPVLAKTEKILDILHDLQVPAAFFCIGNRVKQHPETLKRIHSEGHIVGNHSYWHGKMFDLQPASRILKELKDTDAIVNEAISLRPKFFRPPYGVTNPMVAASILEGGYKTIGWSLRSMDTITKDPRKLFSKVTRSLTGGDIILFHDFCDSTIEILPEYIKFIRENGFTIVRLDTLLNEEPYA